MTRPVSGDLSATRVGVPWAKVAAATGAVLAGACAVVWFRHAPFWEQALAGAAGLLLGSYWATKPPGQSLVGHVWAEIADEIAYWRRLVLRVVIAVAAVMVLLVAVWSYAAPRIEAAVTHAASHAVDQAVNQAVDGAAGGLPSKASAAAGSAASAAGGLVGGISGLRQRVARAWDQAGDHAPASPSPSTSSPSSAGPSVGAGAPTGSHTP